MQVISSHGAKEFKLQMTSLVHFSTSSFFLSISILVQIRQHMRVLVSADVLLSEHDFMVLHQTALFDLDLI
jgi:hypothetical protein